MIRMKREDNHYHLMILTSPQTNMKKVAEQDLHMLATIFDMLNLSSNGIHNKM